MHQQIFRILLNTNETSLFQVSSYVQQQYKFTLVL